VADEKDGSGKPQEERIFARLQSKPGESPAGVAAFVGLMGRSSKPGHWMLYLNLDMSTCVEINEGDILHTEQLPPDRSPFGSLGGTLAFVKKGAQVTTTQTVSKTHEAGTASEFDLDVRLPRGVGVKVNVVGSTDDTCPDVTCRTCTHVNCGPRPTSIGICGTQICITDLC